MKTYAALLLLPLALAGCDSADTKAPGAETGTKATPTGAPKAGAEVSAFVFPKLSVGQFVEYRKGTKRYAWAVVGEQEGGFWLQLSADVEGQPMVMHMLVDVVDGSQINTAKPRKMKFKIPGRGVQEVDGAMLGMSDKMRSQGTFLIDMPAAEISKGKREDVSVKAGAFPSAFRWEAKIKTGPATFWSHPSVPITAIVKGVDPQGAWELVAYGMTGAKSEL